MQYQYAREDLWLRYRYAGNHIAFIDSWNDMGELTLDRTVIAKADSPQQLEAKLQKMKQFESRQIRKLFVSDESSEPIRKPIVF